MMTITFAYLSVILYRNKRWTQEEYDQWKKLRKQRKLENRMESENYKIEKKRNQIENRKRKMENKYKIDEMTSKYKNVKVNQKDRPEDDDVRRGEDLHQVHNNSEENKKGQTTPKQDSSLKKH